jgi:hypothetical protein
MVKGEPCYSWRGLFFVYNPRLSGYTLIKAFTAICANIPANSISLQSDCLLGSFVPDKCMKPACLPMYLQISNSQFLIN